jgi:hypothetical protein
MESKRRVLKRDRQQHAESTNYQDNSDSRCFLKNYLSSSTVILFFANHGDSDFDI